MEMHQKNAEDTNNYADVNSSNELQPKRRRSSYQNNFEPESIMTSHHTPTITGLLSIQNQPNTTGLMSHTTTPQFPFHLPEPNFQYPTPSGPVMPPPSLIMRGNTNIQQLSSNSPLSTQQRSNQIYTQSYPAENYLRYMSDPSNNPNYTVQNRPTSMSFPVNYPMISEPINPSNMHATTGNMSAHNLPVAHTDIPYSVSTTGSLMESKTPWGVSAREPEVKNIISSNPQVPTSFSLACVFCGKAIGDEPRVDFGHSVFHEYCFVCFECQIPLHKNYFEKEGRPYCEACNKGFSRDPKGNQTDNTATRRLKLRIKMQPELFQIANYNIYPAPEIFFEEELPYDISIQASLIEAESYKEVPQGFQTEASREMRTGAQMKTFSGLKLSKKGVIKNFLKDNGLKPKNMAFCIRFSVGNQTWHSRSFKILSSCSQLPPHLRDSIRPFAVSTSPHQSSTTTKQVQQQQPIYSQESFVNLPFLNPMMVPDQFMGYMPPNNSMSINFIVGDRHGQQIINNTRLDVSQAEEEDEEEDKRNKKSKKRKTGTSKRK